MADRTCSVPGCDAPIHGHGWCNNHLRRWRKHGDPGPAKIKRIRTPVIDGHKECGGCHRMLPLSAYGKHPTAAGGRKSHCRECAVLQRRAFRQRNPDYWAEWQRANQDKVNASVQMRRAARNGIGYERIDRAVVFERDGFICQICGDPLDMGATRATPLAPTIDHIIPLSKGGEHRYANVQAAHFVCNVSKGDRIPA